MPNIYKINVSPKPLTNLTAVLTFTDDSTSTRTDWIEADTYYTITETTIKTLKSLTISANNYITQTLETSDLDIDITLSPNIKYVSKIKNNGVVYTLKDESVDSKIEGLANKTLSNVSSIDNNSAVATALNGKQATLVSGTNIKTVNNNSLLGSGNITIDSLPSQSGQSGKFLTTNGTTASWSTVSIPTVDQTFNSSSANAQSGVAIAGELANYLQASNGNITFTNGGTTGGVAYADSGTGEMYGTFIGYTPFGHGVMMGAVDPNGYLLGVAPSGINIIKGTTAHPTNGIALTVTNNNTLAINGTEVALSTDIPTNISDLTDDTATNPVDKADTLTGLTATVTELNYTDGVTSNIQTQFDTITGKIPSQASTSNQLADKAFVNSSVQTATANFRGNWDTWALVPTSASSYPADYAGSTTPTVNDYLVVQDASDYTGDTLEGTWRFKYTGVWSTDGKSGWIPEYQVNETPLTSAQLNALNSGITSNDVTLIGTALQPNDNISSLTNNAGYITGISSSDVTTALGYTPYNSLNPAGYITGINSSMVTTALGYNPVSDTAMATALNGKQDTLVSGTNIKTVNSTSLLGSGNIDIDTIYWATYGTTTFSQIQTAVNNGNTVILDYNGKYLPLVYFDADVLQKGIFSAVYNCTEYNATITFPSSWSNNSFAIAKTSDIPTVPTNISAFTNDSGYITSSSLTDYVTTNTDQNITGTKTFVGQKKVGFKQSSSSDKLGFTLYNNSGTEKGYLEYNPSNTVDSVPLMTLGNYASASGGLTHVGFRKYSSISGASGAYNLLAPLISDARTPFSLTTTYTNFYLPLGFTDGTTTVKTAKTGVVDISSFGYVKNTATASTSLALLGSATLNNAIAFGNNATASKNRAIAIGYSANASGGDAVAIGSSASATDNSASAFGNGAEATSTFSTALGTDAKATANNAIQIGYGTNNTSYSLQVSFGTGISASNNYPLLDGLTGLIPDARLSSNIARTSAIPTVPTNVSAFTNDAGYLTSIPSGYLQNTATGTNSLTIKGLVNSQYANSVNIGDHSSVGANYSLALGSGSLASGVSSIAIGSNYTDGKEAKATAQNSIQIGSGTNNTANTLQVGNYQVLDTSTGLIPDARISTNIARTSSVADNTLSNVSSISSSSAVKTALDTKVNTSDIWYDSTSKTLYIGVAP